MVALSPRFTFLATLCTLTAISMAPLSEAAVLQLRASHPLSMEVSSTLVNTRPTAAASHGHYTLSTDSRADSQAGDKIYAPLLSMPTSVDAPPKNKTDSSEGSGTSGSKSDRKSQSSGDSHGKEDVSEGDESKHASHGDKSSVSEGEKAKDKGRRWNLPYPMERLKDFFGDKMMGDNYVRSPEPHRHHHHHHHHHGRRRSRMNWAYGTERVVSGDNERIVYSRTPYHYHRSHEKVAVSGDQDHVHVGRSPHYHHHHDGHHDHHDHHDGHDHYDEKVIVSGDDDHVHVGREPHHHHHHDDKVVVSGDNDHVHIHRSLSITGEQGQSYIVPHVAKRATAQESFALPSLGKRSSDIDGAPGSIDIVSPDADSTEGKRIACLVLAPSNSTSDNTTTHGAAFDLNASKTDCTKMYLRPTSDSFSQSISMFTSDERGVMLQVAMFNMTSASISPYCASFDPNPPEPAPLTVEECSDNPVGEHRSQLFAYNKVTGAVRPMWFNGEDDGTEPETGDCSSDAPPTPQNASLASATEVDTKNVTSTPSAAPTRSGNSTVLSADAPQAPPSNSSGSSSSGAQKVALVFVAADPEVPGTPAGVVKPTTSSALATSTGAGASDNVASTENGSSTTMMASSSPGSLAATSPAVLATASGSSSVLSSALPPTASNAAISAPVSTSTPGSVSSSAAAVSGPNSTPTTVLGVQVVPTMEGSAPSTSSTGLTPAMTPVSTQPYEWMFKPNSRP